MRAYEPSIADQFLNLFPGDRAKSANEANARRIAREQGISVDEAYRQMKEAVGVRGPMGARPSGQPMFNPEGRAPIKAAVEATPYVFEGIKKAPAGAAEATLRAIRGGAIEDSIDQGFLDQIITNMADDKDNLPFDPNYQGFQGLGKSLGFSLASMVSSAVAGTAATVATGGNVPIGIGAGMAASGTMAYRASKDDFLNRLRDKLNKDSERLYGTKLTTEQWQAARDEFDAEAVKYGAWEAVPEALSNAIFLKAFAKPAFTAGAKRLQGLMDKAGALAVENITETATGYGQNAAEFKAGLTNDEIGIVDAFKQQFIQTGVMMGVMGGGMKGKQLAEKFYNDQVLPRVNPGSALAKAIKADIDAVAYSPEAIRQEAVRRLRPDQAQYEMQGLEPVPSVRPATITPPEEEPIVAPPAVTSPVAGATNLTFVPLSEAPKPGGRVEPSLSEAPITLAPEPRGRVEPPLESAPPPAIVPPKVEAVPGMMTEADLAQPENLTITPVTVTEPEVTPVSPALTETPTKDKWLKAINDQNRLQPEGGVQLTVTPEGKLNFMGDPSVTKQGRALDATLHEAIKAGATIEEIAASILSAQRPAPPVTPVTPIKPTPAAASLPESPTVPPAKTPKLFEPTPAEHQAQDMSVVAVPVKDLTLSKDVPQFKAGASDKGVVEPLSGKFTQEGVAPIAVWRRLDGTMEVISGRHRLDLAKRTGTELINAQVYDEASGFDKAKAAILDAELNIRDEQGKVKDYVNYFKASGTDRETADAKGFLARTKGKRGFTIANQGSDALVAAINSDQIGDEAAYYVAINAPNDERLQNVGLQSIMDGKSMNTAVNTMQAVKAMAVEQDTTTDMFGFDDSLIKEAQEMAKIASKMQQSIQTRLAAITGAAKNPAMAKAEGIDVRDPNAIKRRIEELRAQKAALENWSTSPELVAEIRAARGVEAPQLELRGETEAEIRAREATQDVDRQAQEEKDIADRERDFFQLQPQVAEREEAPTVDMFGAADMAQQPARTAPTAPPITEGLFAPTAKPEAKPLSKEMQQVKKLMLAEEDMYFTDDAQELQGALKNKNWVAYAGRPVYEARGKRKSELIDVQDLEKINTQEELDAALEQGKQIGFLEADKVTAKPTQAVDEEAATIVDDTTTPAQREDAETHAKDVGGTIVWQQGENALIRGYSMLTGDPVYIPTFGTSRARIDIESFSGAQLSPELKRDMIDAKKKAEQDAEEKHKRNPFVKFVDKVAVSEGISSEIEGVIREWKKLLKLDIPLYVGTIEDARRNKDEYTGPHRRIGSGTLDKGEAGSTRRMADGSHYILLSKSTSPTYMLETLAHELGHIHQKIVYENASPADKNALQNAHKKWLESQKGKTAKELIDSLRGRATQRRPKPSASQKAEDLTSYWRSFSEWYADQTSRWAMSDKVPVTAVEKFFKRLGNQLRRFYQQLKARKYLPDDTFAQYINRVTESTPALVPDQDDIANQMSIETEPSKDSSAEPSQGVDGAATDDKNLLEKYNRPNTPQLDPTPLKTEIVDAGKLGKDFFTYAVSDPLEALGSAANSVDRAILYARNKNVWFGSGLNAADFSKYNGELQTSQGLATASVALDNAIRGGQIAAEVIFQGGIKFDQKSRNFVAVKRNKGMAGVYEAEIALKKRLGDQLGTDIIQGYLEAKRSRSIQNEYFAREAEYELFKNDYEELRAANAPEEDIMAARDAMAEAKGGLAAIEVVYNKIRMSDPEIDEFIARDAVHPELRKIMDNWSAINQNMLAFWRQVGLLSEKRYENLSNIKDYVPWQRIMNDETDVHSPVQASNRKMTNIGLEKLFKKGAPTVITDFVAKDGQQTFKIQPATVLEVEINGEPVAQNKVTATADGQVKLDVPVTEGDLVVFKASREIENIIDNMTRNVMRMTMNGLRQAAAQRIVMEYATRNKKGKIMMFPKADKERGRFDFIVNGQRVVVEIQDPLIAESIFGMESLDIAMLAPLAAVANFTRRTITLSGVFQIKQVFKDAPTAALVTGVKRPLVLIGGVYKGFVTSLLNTDPTIKILKAAGIGGFQSLARTPEAEIKRRLGIMNRNVFDFVIKGLDHIGDASDMAQRVAVYKRVLAETGNETQALYQAANVINFLHHGSGQVSQAIVKTVPFAGAYANSMDVLIQALAGGGLKGRSRANALARLAATGTLLAGITLLYCFLVGDDEDYNQMDDQTKLRNFMIPGTKILLPMNTSAAYFYKAIPEMIYNRVVKEGTNNAVDERRLRTALKKAAVDMLLGPTPVPSAIKPFIELGLNKDFFTGRAVVPEALAKLDAAERYTAATSEAGKYLSSLTGTPEKRLLDPIEADHLIRGLFGTAGAMVQWFTNSIAVATGDRPALTDKEQPITGPFLRADVGRRNEDLFYDFKSVVDNKYGTFAKMLEREDEEAAEAYEEKHSDVLVFYKSVNKMEDDLKNINKTIRYYGESKGTGLTPDQRREEIKLLQLDKQEILDDVIEMRQEAGL
jgi:hypothetical protein